MKIIPALDPNVACSEPFDQNSLGSALDSIAESLFFQREISAINLTAIARWIAQRQGLPGSYAGMFAPTERDAAGIRLFTGEVVCSRIGIAHLLGEEACRVLSALKVNDVKVRNALDRAVEGMVERVDQTEQRGYPIGTYCCGTCSIGYWRNLAINLFPRAEERLRLGMVELKHARRQDGRWRRFPFYYTSLALTEIGPALARAEMQHAATSWRRILPRLFSSTDVLATRRAEVGRRLLELCESLPN